MIFDPVNEKSNVAGIYDETNRQKIVAAATNALDAIAYARFATTRGKAIECWQKVRTIIPRIKNMTIFHHQI